MPVRPVEAASDSSTSLTITGARDQRRAGSSRGSRVTTVLRGTTSAGPISTATCLRLLAGEVEEARKHLVAVRLGQHLGRPRSTVERQRRPSRSGSTTSGKPADEPGGDLAVVGRTPGEPELAVEVVEERWRSRGSGMRPTRRTRRGRRGSRRGAACSPRSRSARWRESARAAERAFTFMHPLSHAISGPPETHEDRPPSHSPARRSRTSPGILRAPLERTAASRSASPRHLVRPTRTSPETRQAQRFLTPHLADGPPRGRCGRARGAAPHSPTVNGRMPRPAPSPFARSAVGTVGFAEAAVVSAPCAAR